MMPAVAARRGGKRLMYHGLLADNGRRGGARG